MKKTSMKPVAKAAGAPKTASKPSTVKASSPSPYAAEDKRWKTEDAMRTLMRAEELKKDKTLMKDVACLAKEQAAKLSGLVGKGK
ncbi:hypothetical protein LZK73_18425 [Neorhizobium galegae]|nr:hypothetical protein LZK73_18425 [Neorhizobium galegae]